ncbi:translation initiation factor IF-2-like [Anthonomus grandis grandis]|uniref:translation initiation factor IF-2-like n=1 Tax=Anthonomus grandis grandis TaxID=2921223 RepID=UPI002165D471|nr:translation initiation factor IF-2-like [Anthonomus grandis grandis]
MNERRTKCSSASVGLLMLLLVFTVQLECKKLGGRTWSSRPASRPSTHYRPSPPSRPVSHPSPASLSYPISRPSPSPKSPSGQVSRPIGLGGLPSPSHGLGSGSTNTAQKPIGFEKISPVGSSAGPKGPPSAPNFGFGAGGSSPGKLGFENVKPVGSAATGGHKTGSGHPGTGTGSGHPGTGTGSGHPSTGTGSHGSGSSGGSSSGNAPNYGWNLNQRQGSPGNTKPSAPSEHSVNSKPLGNANSGGHPSAPVGPPTNVKPVGNAPPPGAPYQVHPPPYNPHNPGVPPPSYHPTHNAAGYGAPPAYSGYGPPAYPGYGQHGYPGGYHPQGGAYGYGAAPGGITNVNINNINTNTHYGGGGGFGGGFGGFGGYSYPSYSYTSREVGSGALGFFLGYSLAKLTTPTFHYSAGSYSGYTPRYDHYEVHHYYHNRDSVPPQRTIEPNAIVGCIGDSGTICPAGTTSLCTNNGAILCVASATSTVPCSDVKGANCVQTIVPCVNGTGDCNPGENKTVTIPCISKAEVPGNITYVNNTIITVNTTIINNNFNGTSVNSTSVTNGTTTTELPVTTLLPNVTSDGAARSKREAATHVNEFCVTILALPAERKPSEQEQLVDRSTDIFAKFLVRALGVN